MKRSDIKPQCKMKNDKHFFFHFDKTVDFINSLRIQAFPHPICKTIQNPFRPQLKNKKADT